MTETVKWINVHQMYNLVTMATNSVFSQVILDVNLPHWLRVLVQSTFCCVYDAESKTAFISNTTSRYFVNIEETSFHFNMKIACYITINATNWTVINQWPLIICYVFAGLLLLDLRSSITSEIQKRSCWGPLGFFNIFQSSFGTMRIFLPQRFSSHIFSLYSENERPFAS